MKALGTILAMVLTCVPSAGGNASGDTEVIILGTLHGAHSENADYSPVELRRVLLALQPAAILTESPDSFVDEHGRIPRSVYEGVPGAVESPIENEVADSLRIRLYPFDRPDRQEHFARTRHDEREQAAGALFMQWYQEMMSEDSAAVDLQPVRAGMTLDAGLAELMRVGSARAINSVAYDEMIRALKILQHDVLPPILDRQPGYEQVATYLRFDREQWLERNTIMASRIAATSALFRGRRVVAITGARHRYALRDLLSNRPGIVLREFWQVLDK